MPLRPHSDKLEGVTQALLCPRCGGALAAVGVPIGVALGCGPCAGVLLDDAAFGHVRERMYASLAHRAPARRATFPDGSAALACPACASHMTRTKIGEVEVDLCSRHGVWFDRDELATVAQMIALARTEPARPSSRLSETDREYLARSVSSQGLGSAIADDVFSVENGERLLSALAWVLRGV